MKMNNQGFTLVELLAVIVLLAVIATIATPSIMGISRKIKAEMLTTKIDLILEDAKLYGQDHMSNIASKTTKFKGYTCLNTSIGELRESGYLSSDKSDEEAGCIVNPVDNTCLDEYKIILYIKNKRIVSVLSDANMDGTNENSCR